MKKELLLGTPIEDKIKYVVDSVNSLDELENITGMDDRLAKKLFDSNANNNDKELLSLRLRNANRIVRVYNEMTGEKSGLSIKTKFILYSEMVKSLKLNNNQITAITDMTYQSFYNYVNDYSKLDNINVGTAMKIEKLFKEWVQSKKGGFEDIYETLNSVELHVPEFNNEGIHQGEYEASLRLMDGKYKVIEPLDNHDKLKKAIKDGKNYSFTDKEVNEDYTVYYTLSFEELKSNTVRVNCEKKMVLGNF